MKKSLKATAGAQNGAKHIEADSHKTPGPAPAMAAPARGAAAGLRRPPTWATRAGSCARAAPDHEFSRACPVLGTRIAAPDMATRAWREKQWPPRRTGLQQAAGAAPGAARPPRSPRTAPARFGPLFCFGCRNRSRKPRPWRTQCAGHAVGGVGGGRAAPRAHGGAPDGSGGVCKGRSRAGRPWTRAAGPRAPRTMCLGCPFSVSAINFRPSSKRAAAARRRMPVPYGRGKGAPDPL